MTTTLTTTLRVYDDEHPETLVLETSDGQRIADELRAVGVRFERWAADAQLPKGADQQTVIDAYRSSIEKLVAECGYQTMDVIRLERGTPNTEPMRKKFLDEHQHSEDEVRFFVEGRGAFYLHINGNQRACIEQRIEELKSDLAADDFCLREFFATEAAFLGILMLFNLLGEFQRAGGMTGYRQPATLRVQVFLCGAILGRTGHHTVLHLSAAWEDSNSVTRSSTNSYSMKSQLRRSWIFNRSAGG